MPKYLAAATMALLVGMVLARALLMKRKGVAVMNFGKIDRTDFLILPFAFFYFYLVFAGAFDLPGVGGQTMFSSAAISWAGVFFCAAGLCLMGWSLISFGSSFRIGIDLDGADELVTTGAFGFSRNPIYAAFGLVLAGQFLVSASWVLLVYLGGGIWLFHRQVLREEAFLKGHYGEEYGAYCRRVRRYF